MGGLVMLGVGVGVVIWANCCFKVLVMGVVVHIYGKGHTYIKVSTDNSQPQKWGGRGKKVGATHFVCGWVLGAFMGSWLVGGRKVGFHFQLW